MQQDMLLPEFSKIKIDEIEPMLDAILAQNRSEIETLLAQQHEHCDWNSLVLPLEEIDERLNDFWGKIIPLQGSTPDTFILCWCSFTRFTCNYECAHGCILSFLSAAAYVPQGPVEPPGELVRVVISFSPSILNCCTMALKNW